MAVVVYVPSRLGEGYFTDLPAPTAADDAKAITYDHGTGAFVYAAAGGGTPGGSDTYVQFNDGGVFGGDAGLTYAKATDRLTVTGGLVAGDWSPPSDSVTAVSIWNAARSSRVVTVDTANKRVRVDQNINSLAWAALSLRNSNVGSSAQTRFDLFNNSGESSGVNGFSFFLTNAAWASPYTSAAGFWHYENGPLLFATNALERLRILANGYVAVGQTSATALLDIAASTINRASLRLRSGTTPTTPNDGDAWNDGNAYAIMVNGTNAVNTDGGLSVWMQSSTNERNVGRLLWQYTDKTDATRATRGSVTAFYTTTEYKPISWGANSSGPLLSFGAVTTPIPIQVLATGAGASVDDVIQALQNLGLVKQS